MEITMASPLIWASIDLDAIGQNITALKQMIAPETAFMAVVKADAYGHGAVRVAKKTLKSGADCLGVARLSEARPLREAGITAPILIFGFTFPQEAGELKALDLTTTVYNLGMARALSRAAVKNGARIKAHLKVDTGMGRLGLLPGPLQVHPEKRGKAVQEVVEILKLPGLQMEGIYTHFAAADSRDKSHARHQIKNFTRFMERLEQEGMVFPLRHAANSAGLIDLPEAHFDMVRAGIAIYGLYPSLEMDRSKITLKPAMTLKSLVTSVKRVPKGFTVSYGMTYKTPGETLIASVPVGYADGYSRLFSSKGKMLIRGQRVPIAGRVCMDQTLLDAGHIKKIEPGDQVVIMGSQDEETISADELAGLTGTINYEVVSTLMPRVARIYSETSAVSG